MYKVEILVKLQDLVNKVNRISDVTRTTVSESKPAFIVTNLYNGDINIYSKVESTFDYLADTGYLVIKLTEPMGIRDKCLIINRVLELKFRQEAIDIIRSRASLSRKSDEPLYIYYDAIQGIIQVIKESEALDKAKYLSDEEIDRTVILEIKSKAIDNYYILNTEFPQLSKQIFHSL